MSDTKKKSNFWKNYWTVVIVFLAIVLIAAIFFWDYLAKFEAKTPQHIATETFNSYFSTYDKVDKYINSSNKGIDDETISEYKTALKNIYEGKEISFYNVVSDVDNSYKYFVKADNIKFASFYLLADEDSWKAANFEFDITGTTVSDSTKPVVKGDKTVIDMPSTYKLTVDGKEIAEDSVIQKGVESKDYERYTLNVPEDLAEVCSYVRYEIDKTDISKIKVTDKNDKEAKLTEKDGVIVAEVVYCDDDMREEWDNYLIKGMELYAKYMQFDESSSVVGFGQVAPYFDPTSDLYEDIKTVENMFVTYYDGVYFEDESISEYVKYSGLEFSCRVQITQVLEKAGWDNTYDYMDITIYLRKVGDDYLIYHMKQN